MLRHEYEFEFLLTNNMLTLFVSEFDCVFANGHDRHLSSKLNQCAHALERTAIKMYCHRIDLQGEIAKLFHIDQSGRFSPLSSACDSNRESVLVVQHTRK